MFIHRISFLLFKMLIWNTYVITKKYLVNNVKYNKNQDAKIYKYPILILCTGKKD